MRLAAIAATGVLAALTLVPTASADPAQVSMHCTSFDYELPQGPPPRVGEFSVVNANGVEVVHHFVPGPCSIPKK